jgi:hypothetical protein
LQHTFQLGVYVLIPKPQHSITLLVEISRWLRSRLAQALCEVLKMLFQDRQTARLVRRFPRLSRYIKKADTAQPGPTDQVSGIEAASPLHIGASCLESGFALIRLPLPLETEGILKPHLGTPRQDR